MKIAKWLFLITLPLLLIFAFLPQILSTSLGNNLFFRLVYKKTGIIANSGQADFSWLGPQKFQYLVVRNKQFRGSAQALEVGTPLWNLSEFFDLKNLNKSTGGIHLKNGSFTFYPGAQLKNVELSGKFHESSFNFIASGSSEQDSQRGSFSLEGKFLSATKFSLHGSLHSFPTTPLDYLFSKLHLLERGVFTQTFGKWMDLEGSASLSDRKGSLDAALKSPNIVCSLAGSLDENLFTLRKPFTANLLLTPEASQWILRKMNPLFLTGIKAKNPIQIHIEPDGFSCPVSNFSLKNLEIDQGTLAMGQVICKNGASLASVLNILKIPPTQEMTIWFSPMAFQLREGTLYTGRMDALIANSAHICTWGTIDLIHEQLHLFLGLTAKTLEKVFGITSLRSDYVLKIPISGSTKNPIISVEGAAVKIAALKASESIFKGTLPGKLLKAFLPNDPDVPPASRPFPWER